MAVDLKSQFVTSSSVPVPRIEQAILVVRGLRAMLSTDLAALYGVEPKVLVQAVKRNIERFPDDFMFQLAPDEFRNLKCQFGISSSWGGRRHAPYVFTERGVAGSREALYAACQRK